MIVYALVLLPYAGALGCAFFPEHARRRVAWLAGLIALAGCVLVALTAAPVMDGEILRASVPWLPGVPFGFRVDGLAWTFALIIYAIGALIVLYASYYLAPSDPPARFFALLLAFMGAMLGVVLADNLILLVVFWELTGVTSFLLIGFWKHRADARQGARMALAITAAGGLCLLGGVIVLGEIAGGYGLDTVLAAGPVIRAHPWYPVALVLILLGAFTKSAQFPFQFWLPHAMAAPTPVSAYLHSATMVKAGVFLLARLYPALGESDLWFYLVTTTGLITLTVGAAIAIFQHDLKGLLAYSTISHLGLVTLLFGLDAPLAVVAGLFHILNHAAFKASLFMAAGIIDHEAGSRDMRQLNGLWRLMPVTATLAMVAAGAMAGVPLLNGFLSKEMFFSETLQLEAHPLYEWVIPVTATIAAGLSVAYSVRFIHDVFFNGEPIGLPRVPHEPPRWMRIPVEALVLVCLAVGIAPAITIAPVLATAARGTLGVGELPAYSLSLWHGLNLPLLMSAVAFAAGVIFYFALQRTLDLHAFTLVRSFGRRLYTAVLALLETGGRALVMRSPAGSLPRSLAWIIGAAVVAMGWPLYVLGIGAPARALPLGDPDQGIAVLGLVAWVMAVGGALGVTLLYRHRFLAVVLIGAAGLAVSFTFLLLSAPDLALTQLLVEIASVALIMAVLHRLPATSPKEAGTTRKVRDAVLAIVAGAGLTWIVHAVLTRSFDPISPYFLERSLTEGGGTNVVNVILVDFRGFDTLGEITVLGIAGLLVFALLYRLRPPGPRWMQPVTGWNPLLIRTVVRTLLPLAAMVAIYLFLRGHNQPGGGFIAGLTLACALVAMRIGGGGRPLDASAGSPFAPAIGVGLLIAGGTGLGSLAVGYPFLTSTFAHPVLPWLGEIPLASAALFDLGVFVTVVSATLLATFTPGLLPAAGDLAGVRDRENER